MQRIVKQTQLYLGYKLLCSQNERFQTPQSCHFPNWSLIWS